MPSQTSLAEQQYYAHPRNAFWWIMSQLTGVAAGAAYAERESSLKSLGIALWDVLFDCHRPGSLDSNIQRDSEQPNDFANLLADTPSIKLIAFNGAAARQIFMRHCKHVLRQFPNIDWVQLPSTSPAHAAMSREQKLAMWRSELGTGAGV